MASFTGAYKFKFLALLTASLVAHTDAAATSAPVTIGLRTGWPAHNLLLEIL
jgi:hypothetical protein